MQEHSRSVNGLDCVYVGRPGKYGNPYVLNEVYQIPDKDKLYIWRKLTAQEAVDAYEKDINGLSNKEIIIKNLQGKNLACFCPLDKPCHADILLKIANE